MTQQERKPPKRITVDILCLVVDSDGFPVNMHGEPLNHRQKPFYEWDKRRISANKFCPNNVRISKRRTVHYLDLSTAQPMKCNCHGRMKLIHISDWRKP